MHSSKSFEIHTQQFFIISKSNIVKNTLTFPYPHAKCESNYIRIAVAQSIVYTCTYAYIHLIELSVYLVIIRSIMSTFHASSLALFRQVRFFIRNPAMFGYSALQRIILSLATSLWRIHRGRLIRSPVRPIKRYVCDVVHLPLAGSTFTRIIKASSRMYLLIADMCTVVNIFRIN